MNQQTDSVAEAGLAQRPVGVFTGQRKLFITIALLAVAVGYFAFTAFQAAAVFYLTVGEVVSGGAEVGQTVRVSGKLVPDSFQREAEGTVVHFSLTDGSQTLPAVYDGILPEMFFNPQSNIVLEGYYDSEGVFQGNTIILKCPSKYKAVAEEQSAVAQ